MQLSISGKQVDIGDALREHVAGRLDATLEKYFGTAIEAHLAVSKEAHSIRADLSVHIGRGIVVNAGGTSFDAYTAFDAAAERVAKQLRRYKRRLRHHHGKTRGAAEAVERARNYVLAPVSEDAEEDGETGGGEDSTGAPAVIAEASTDLPSLTVGEASMRMDLADAPVLLFRNRSHGELNVVFRRPDGNIGWIDPEFAAALRTGKRKP
jgi:ribosomal subunit interface protein